jgi:hypothetical protein
MNISTFFKLIKAPLKNTRWSWGAARKDGAVVLRVWQQDISNGMVIVRGIGYKGPGSAEREQHLATGTGFYCVTCRGTDKDGISGFDKRDVWYGRELSTVDGITYLKLMHRVAVGELI